MTALTSAKPRTMGLFRALWHLLSSLGSWVCLYTASKKIPGVVGGRGGLDTVGD